MRDDVWQELLADRAPGVQPDGETFAVTLKAGAILLPIREVGDGRAVASLIFNQASFKVQDALADLLAARLAPHAPDMVVGVPTLGLPLAEAVARRLGHRRMVPLGTSRKVWYDPDRSVALRSSTTPGGGKRLYIDPRILPRLAEGRIALIDDVLATGTSMDAALRLLRDSGAEPVAIGAAMAQGEAWRTRIRDLPVETAFTTPILTRGPGGWT